MILQQTLPTCSDFIICGTENCCHGLRMHLTQTPTRATICFGGFGFALLDTYGMYNTGGKKIKQNKVFIPFVLSALAVNTAPVWVSGLMHPVALQTVG